MEACREAVAMQGGRGDYVMGAGIAPSAAHLAYDAQCQAGPLPNQTHEVLAAGRLRGPEHARSDGGRQVPPVRKLADDPCLVHPRLQHCSNSARMGWVVEAERRRSGWHAGPWLRGGMAAGRAAARLPHSPAS